MAINSVGFGSTILNQSLLNLNNALTTLQSQLTTGKKSTSYAGMGANEGFAIAARGQLANISAFTDTMSNINTSIGIANTGLQSMVDQLAQIPLDFSPGTAWNYSVAIDVLGYLVEKLSGMRFGEFLRTRLFEPLGMNDTAFWVPPEKTERFTSCYQPEGTVPGLKLQDDARESTYANPPKLESGGGGLVSTAQDYLRFCRMMINGGSIDGVQILSPKTVALFSLNYLPEGREIADMALPGMFSESGYAGVGFSLGCGVNVNVAKTRLPGSLGEYFWGGAAATAFWIDPKEQLTVVFMTQVIGSEARLTLRRDLRTLVYSAMTESFA